VKKGNTQLLTAINDALKASTTDGSYAKIYVKWFGKAPTWLPAAK
jgi:polar amino acid transport system substrate-binding protein